MPPDNRTGSPPKNVKKNYYDHVNSIIESVFETLREKIPLKELVMGIINSFMLDLCWEKMAF